MNKFYNTMTNERGDSLPEYRAQVVTSAGVVVDIFADESGTRFTNAAGIVNYATADSSGVIEFYWTAADRQVLQILDPSGNLVRSIAGFADNFVLDNLAGVIAISGVTGLTAELAAKVPTATLAASGGSASVGFLQGGASAIARTVQDKVGETVSVKDFGAVGNGTTNDYAAIVLARAAAIAIGGGLHFPQGDYAFGTTLELAYANLHITFGGKVTLRHTGSGIAVSFDAGPTELVDGVRGVHFGWDNAPRIIGSATTTDLVYVRGSHDMLFNADLRDCNVGLRCVFSVGSFFRFVQSNNYGAFSIQRPATGLIVTKRGTLERTTNCFFDFSIEGLSGLGVDLIHAHHCTFTGTSEGNDNGGLRASTTTDNNTFKMFCEQNGTGKHWDVAGNYNIFENCSGGNAANTGLNSSTFSGIRNKFDRGVFSKVTDSGYFNEWDQTQLVNRVSIAPLNILKKCYDEAFAEIQDQYPAPNRIAPTLQDVWVVANDIGGMGLPRYHKDSHGYVRLSGGVKLGNAGTVMFTLPAGFRPAATKYFTYVAPSAGTTGYFAVSSTGEVQHISGTNASVCLDGAIFLAEA